MDWVGATGKQKSWTPPRRRERATTGLQPPRTLRDTNRRLTKEDEVRTRGLTAPKTDTAADKDSPQMEEGLNQGRAEREREREGRRRTKRDLKPGAPVRSKQVGNPPRV